MWNNDIMDTKLRLSPQDANMIPPCPFPSHKHGFPHMDKFFIPPCRTNASRLLMMLEDDKMSMVVLKTPYYDVVSLQYTCFEIHFLIFYTFFIYVVWNFYHHINFMNKGFLIVVK